MQGQVELVMPGDVRRLQGCDGALLPAGQRHGLCARGDAAVLVTQLLKGGSAGDGCGRSNAAKLGSGA